MPYDNYALCIMHSALCIKKLTTNHLIMHYALCIMHYALKKQLECLSHIVCGSAQYTRGKDFPIKTHGAIAKIGRAHV